jgi:hypothetical protein
MSGTTLDLMDAPIYEARLVGSWAEVLQLYAQGWRCVAAGGASDATPVATFYVLERPVR